MPDIKFSTQSIKDFKKLEKKAQKRIWGKLQDCNIVRAKGKKVRQMI